MKKLLFLGSLLCVSVLHGMKDASAEDLLLFDLIGSGLVDEMRACLDKGARIEARKENLTPLIHASLCGDIKAVELFLQKNAFVNARGPNGITALYWAAQQGAADICALLLDSGAEINAANEDGWTPLMVAAFSGHADVCKLLIDEEASLNLRNNNGATALIISAQYQHPVVCQLLIERGADVDIKDNQQDTALFWADFNVGINFDAYELQWKNICAMLQARIKVKFTPPTSVGVNKLKPHASVSAVPKKEALEKLAVRPDFAQSPQKGFALLKKTSYFYAAAAAAASLIGIVAAALYLRSPKKKALVSTRV